MLRSLVFGILICGGTSPAWADGFALSLGHDLTTLDLYGAGQYSNLSTRIGYKTGGLVIYGMLDYANITLESESQRECYSEFDCYNEGGYEANASVLTLGAGVRYLWGDARAGEVLPYLGAALFTLLPEADDGDDDAADDVSSLGGLAGGGLEYFFAAGFSLGGEIGLSYVNADDGDGTSLSLMQVYSAIQFNFYL